MRESEKEGEREESKAGCFIFPVSLDPECFVHVSSDVCVDRALLSLLPPIAAERKPTSAPLIP